MKQSPEFEIIQANMLPGTLSAHGFLGEDRRNLTDILQADERSLRNLELSGPDLAAAMHRLTDTAIPGLGRPMIVDELFEVTVEDYMGRMPCPFQDNSKVDKRQTLVRRLDTGVIMRWTDLNIHMIEHHNFFEGLGSAYRLDPIELARFLKLV